MIDLLAVGQRLKSLRGAQTIKEFAQKLSVPMRTYMRYEAGEREPALDILLKISRAYKVSIDWMVLGLSQDIDRPALMPSGRRNKLLELYNNQCALCGFGEIRLLKVAHIKPLIMGGTNEFDNIVILCPNCNARFDQVKSVPNQLLKYIAANKSALQAKRGHCPMCKGKLKDAFQGIRRR